MFIASQEGHGDVVQALLGAGADVNLSISVSKIDGVLQCMQRCVNICITFIFCAHNHGLMFLLTAVDGFDVIVPKSMYMMMSLSGNRYLKLMASCHSPLTPWSLPPRKD